MKRLLAIIISLAIIGGAAFGVVTIFGKLKNQDVIAHPEETMQISTELEIESIEETQQEEPVKETPVIVTRTQHQYNMTQVPNLDELDAATLKTLLVEVIGSEENVDKLMSISDKCSTIIKDQKHRMMSAGIVDQTSDYYKYLYDNKYGKVYLVSLADKAFEEMIIFECSIDGSYTNYMSIYKELVDQAVNSFSWVTKSTVEDYRAVYPTIVKQTTAATTIPAITQQEATTSFSVFGTNGHDLNGTTEAIYTTEVATTEVVTTQYTTEATTIAETPEAGPHNFSADEPSKAYDTLVFINAVTSTSTFYNTWASAFSESEVKQARALASKYMQKVYDTVLAKNTSYRPEVVFSAVLDESTNTLIIRANANNCEGIVCVLNSSATVTDNSDEWVRKHNEK